MSDEKKKNKQSGIIPINPGVEKLLEQIKEALNKPDSILRELHLLDQAEQIPVIFTPQAIEQIKINRTKSEYIRIDEVIRIIDAFIKRQSSDTDRVELLQELKDQIKLIKQP